MSVVVQTAAHTLLYDAGGKYSEQSDAGSRIVLPFLRGEGISRLDGFIVSHDDTDHSGGMSAIMAQMPVGWLASSLPEPAAINSNAKRMRCFAGQSWQWDGVQFEMMHPELASYDDEALTDNNRSCVLKITSTSGSLLLTGDIEKSAELALISQQQNNQDMIALKSDVMLAPHHGSRTSSGVEFVTAVQPKLTVFTVGYLNRFKHPRPDVVKRYLDLSSNIMRSDYHGAVTLDYGADNQGNAIKVGSWREQHKRYWHDIYW